MPIKTNNICYCDPCYPRFCCVPVTACPNNEKRCCLKPVKVPVVPESAFLTPLMIPAPCCQPTCPAGYIPSPPPRPFPNCTPCQTIIQSCPPCPPCEPCCTPPVTCGPCPPCSMCTPRPCPPPPCAI